MTQTAASEVTTAPANPGGSLTRLRQAARTLFVDLGYHETRPQDIARKAGVANGTFYLHFADKQQAYLDFAEQAQNELISSMSEQLQRVSGQRQRWQTTLESLLDFGEAHPGLLQAAFLDPVLVAPNDENAWRMYDRLGHLVSMALKESGRQSDMGLEMISHGLCGFLRHAISYAGRRNMDREKVIRDLSEFIDRGLGDVEKST